MTNFSSALWVEILKLRRSRVPLFTGLGYSIAPLVGGLFMIILKDPARAQTMGLISTKAQLAAGTAEWSTLFNMLAQANAVGGGIIFAVFTAWVFGREFSDHTAKELLALPTSRESIVAAKFFAIAAWAFLLTLLCYMPGWSTELFRSATIDIIGAGTLTISLMPFVAFFASAGKGYLPSFGWTIFSVVMAQIAVITGWGDWFPWSVPAIFSGAVGPRAEFMGMHSYVIITLASLIGLAATFYWWRNADQTK
jgi:ABC-2 type transport system permease protein